MATRDEKLGYGFSTKFLNKNKQIKNLVNKAVDNEWTQQRFLDELRETSWWRKRSDAEKQFEVLKVENPEELKSQLKTANRAVRNMSVRLGVGLSLGQIQNIGRSWVRNGLNEDEVRNMVGRKYRHRGSKNMGVAGVARAHLDEMARAYGLRWSNRFLSNHARQIARGRRQVSDYEGYARQQAANTYKAIAPDIREGRTVREVLEPYMQVAAEELGLPSSIMNTTHSKWVRPVSGDHQLSMDEWTQVLRSNRRYGYNTTNKARQEAAVFSQQLMSQLGAM